MLCGINQISANQAASRVLSSRRICRNTLWKSPTPQGNWRNKSDRGQPHFCTLFFLNVFFSLKMLLNSLVEFTHIEMNINFKMREGAWYWIKAEFKTRKNELSPIQIGPQDPSGGPFEIWAKFHFFVKKKFHFFVVDVYPARLRDHFYGLIYWIKLIIVVPL